MSSMDDPGTDSFQGTQMNHNQQPMGRKGGDFQESEKEGKHESDKN